MMVRMGETWDRTVAVMAARASTLVSLTLIFQWLPAMVKLAIQIAVIGTISPGAAAAASPGATAIVQLMGIAVFVLALIGYLALVAVASDPTLAQGHAVRLAGRRFWLYLLVVVIIGVAVGLALLPAALPIAASYPSMAAMQAGLPPAVSPGTLLFAGLYAVVACVVGLWLEARVLLLLAPVIVGERRGLASFARAFRLTRGLAWRIVGVLVLFGIVWVVATFATRWVLGTVFALIFGFGGSALVAFLTAAAVTLVSCALSVVAASFTARLYVATSGNAGGGERSR